MIWVFYGFRIGFCIEGSMGRCRFCVFVFLIVALADLYFFDAACMGICCFCNSGIFRDTNL